MSNNWGKAEYGVIMPFSSVSVASVGTLYVVIDEPFIEIFLQSLDAFIEEVLPKSNAKELVQDGLVEALNDVQRCVIHQIRASTRYLKPIYKAATEENALAALDVLESKWGVKYALGVKSWRANWPELSTMYKYPPKISTLIYTTNAIENFKRQLRKVTKTKSVFVSDDALMKILYLATINITEKWTMPIKNWPSILDHLMIYFGDRVEVKF